MDLEETLLEFIDSQGGTVSAQHPNVGCVVDLSFCTRQYPTLPVFSFGAPMPLTSGCVFVVVVRYPGRKPGIGENN